MTTTKPVHVNEVVNTIISTMKKGGFQVAERIVRGVRVIEGFHEGSRISRYFIGPYSVKGPDPDRHEEPTGFNAVIHNVHELLVVDLDYSDRRYRGFSIQ